MEDAAEATNLLAGDDSAPAAGGSNRAVYLRIAAGVAALLVVALAVFFLMNWIGSATEQPRTRADYYAGVRELADQGDKQAFQAALQALISQHRSLTYAELWTAFRVTDVVDEACPGKLWDMYSAYCWESPEKQCGNYKREGDCFNREHAWPKSWWGGSSALASYTDLFHLYPTDGYANGRRADFSIGNVARNATTRYETSNGSILGRCRPAADPDARATVASSLGLPTSDAIDQVPDTCWEPVDLHKGRFARMYFYMETRYMHAFECCDTDAADGAIIKPWLRATLLEWHRRFPVTATERSRNHIIYEQFQGNRNPFVDHPNWVESII